MVLGLFKSGPDSSDTIVIPFMSHQNAWYLNGPRAVHGRPGVSRYHRDSHRVPSDCLISGWSCGFGGAARPSRYHPVSLRSAWHPGDQPERGTGEGDRERRRGGKGGRKGAGRRDSSEGSPGGHFDCLASSWESFCLSGLLGMILAFWAAPGSHFCCLGSSWESF